MKNIKIKAVKEVIFYLPLSLIDALIQLLTVFIVIYSGNGLAGFFPVFHENFKPFIRKRVFYQQFHD